MITAWFMSQGVMRRRSKHRPVAFFWLSSTWLLGLGLCGFLLSFRLIFRRVQKSVLLHVDSAVRGSTASENWQRRAREAEEGAGHPSYQQKNHAHRLCIYHIIIYIYIYFFCLTCTCRCTCMCLCICMHVYVCIYVHVKVLCVYTYIYMYQVLGPRALRCLSYGCSGPHVSDTKRWALADQMPL